MSLVAPPQSVFQVVVELVISSSDCRLLRSSSFLSLDLVLGLSLYRDLITRPSKAASPLWLSAFLATLSSSYRGDPTRFLPSRSPLVVDPSFFPSPGFIPILPFHSPTPPKIAAHSQQQSIKLLIAQATSSKSFGPWASQRPSTDHPTPLLLIVIAGNCLSSFSGRHKGGVKEQTVSSLASLIRNTSAFTS